MEQTNGVETLRLDEGSGMAVIPRNFCRFQNQVDNPLVSGIERLTGNRRK